jgi:hypothetical protein
MPSVPRASGTRAWTLTPKEFMVLEVLMRAEGAVVSAEDLLEKAWDENADPFTNAVRVALMTLHGKVGPAAGDRDGARRRQREGQRRPADGDRASCERHVRRGRLLRNAANTGQPVGCGDCATVWLCEITCPAPSAGKAGLPAGSMPWRARQRGVR